MPAPSSTCADDVRRPHLLEDAAVLAVRQAPHPGDQDHLAQREAAALADVLGPRDDRVDEPRLVDPSMHSSAALPTRSWGPISRVARELDPELEQRRDALAAGESQHPQLAVAPAMPQNVNTGRLPISARIDARLTMTDPPSPRPQPSAGLR
jgi:hypothetical protein